MASWMTRALMVATVGLGVGTFAAQDAVAQESTNRVAAMTDWSVFVEENPKECWGVSSPKETVNTRDGQPVQVRRGDILLFVTFRAGAVGEISFSGGYPFAGGSTVALDVDGTGYELITDGEWAWAASPAEDTRILDAMRRGQNAVLVARSSRGTQTQDTFNLFGLTAATEEAQRRCAQ